MKYYLRLFLILFFLPFLRLSAQDSLYVLSDVKLQSDGEEGMDTYDLIESVFGTGCIEAPDLYAVNHPGIRHIIETSDEVVGNNFLFRIHRDEDYDRDTGKTDRQRNEIKTYANSASNLKGFNGETMRFHWYFKLDSGFSISKNFSHFFQLKAVGGDDSSQPIVTISGSINSGNEEFEIIYNSGNGTSDKQLSHTNWSKANTGQWMEMEVIATFAEEGYLKIVIRDLAGEVILETERTSIDLWRTGSTFVRPKWGIYRSLKSKSYLNEGEETAGFADFSVQKVTWEAPAGIRSIENKGTYPCKIFPNPAQDNVSVLFDYPERGTLQIINLAGEIMLTQQLNGKTETKLRTGNLRSGMYLMLINNKPAGKFIKR